MPADVAYGSIALISSCPRCVRLCSKSGDKADIAGLRICACQKLTLGRYPLHGGFCCYLFYSGSPALRHASANPAKTSGFTPTITEKRAMVKLGSSLITD